MARSRKSAADAFGPDVFAICAEGAPCRATKAAIQPAMIDEAEQATVLERAGGRCLQCGRELVSPRFVRFAVPS